MTDELLGFRCPKCGRKINVLHSEIPKNTWPFCKYKHESVAMKQAPKPYKLEGAE